MTRRFSQDFNRSFFKILVAFQNWTTFVWTHTSWWNAETPGVFPEFFDRKNQERNEGWSQKDPQPEAANLIKMSHDLLNSDPDISLHRVFRTKKNLLLSIIILLFLHLFWFFNKWVSIENYFQWNLFNSLIGILFPFHDFDRTAHTLCLQNRWCLE